MKFPNGALASTSFFFFIQYTTQDRWARALQEKDWLWESVLLHSSQRGAMMGCSAEGDTEGLVYRDGEQNTGIYSGHAYAVIDVFTLQRSPEELELIKNKQKADTNYHKSHRILRLRNPWGFGEWMLKWSEQEHYRDRLFEFKDQIDAYYADKLKKARERHEDCVEPYVFTKRRKAKRGTLVLGSNLPGSPLKSTVKKP